MGDPKAVILDISSDEEEVSGETSGSGADGGSRDEYDWLMKLLDDDDEPSADSDDVVLVGEVSVKSSSTVSEDLVKAVDDEDGDCVVLEEDPDKPVAVDKDDELGDDSDDLLVVSEKGQVACRDYPHPRHHCAKFPFASTPHESYCDQCHCYVCDSLAPCVYWGNGISSIDHCHATDKDEFWKTQRQNTKKNNEVLPSVPTVDAAPLVQPTLVYQSSSPQLVQPTLANQPPQLVACNVTQNQAFAQGLIRPCSISGITSQHGIQPPGIIVPNRLPGYIVPRSKFRDYWYLKQMQICHGYRNGISTGGRQNACHFGPNLVHSHTGFKRTGSVTRSLTALRHVNNSSHDHHSLGPRYADCNSRVAPATNAVPGSCLTNLSCISSNPVSYQSQLSVQPRLEVEPVNYLQSGPQVFSQPQINAADSVLSESQVFSPSLNCANPVSYQPQVVCQPGLGRTFANHYPSEIHCSSQHVNGAFENSVPSEPQTFIQPYVDSDSMHSAPSHTQTDMNGVNNYENPLHPRSELAYQAKGPNYNNLAQLDFASNGGNGFEATVDCQSVASAEPHMANNYVTSHQHEAAAPVSLGESQNICHPENQTQNALELDGFSREINERHNATSADKSLHGESLYFNDDHFADNSFSSAFDNWNFEDSVAPGLNVYSPEPAPVDSWNLFSY